MCLRVHLGRGQVAGTWYALMDFRVPLNAGNFSINWEPVSFPRRTLLYGVSITTFVQNVYHFVRYTSDNVQVRNKQWWRINFWPHPPCQIPSQWRLGCSKSLVFWWKTLLVIKSHTRKSHGMISRERAVLLVSDSLLLHITTWVLISP